MTTEASKWVSLVKSTKSAEISQLVFLHRDANSFNSSSKSEYLFRMYEAIAQKRILEVCCLVYDAHPMSGYSVLKTGLISSGDGMSEALKHANGSLQ